MKVYYNNSIVEDLHFGPIGLGHTLVVPGKAIIWLESGNWGVADNQEAILPGPYHDIYVLKQPDKLPKGWFEYDVPEDKIDEMLRIAKEYEQVKNRFNGCGSGLLKIIGHENDDAKFSEKRLLQFEKHRSELARSHEAMRKRMLPPPPNAKARR